MKSINITDVKNFMSKLLIKEDFDNFLLEEASITTFNTFTIDGHIHKNYYTSEEYEVLRNTELSYWSTIKPICFELIKGKKTPSRFKIILKADENLVVKISEDSSNILGLYLNIKYEDGTLNCITATSMKSFTLDKTIDDTWDKYIDTYINKIL